MNVLASLVAFSALLATPASPADVRETIKRQLAAYMEAFNKQDVNALLAFYEEDAIRVSPGRTLRGKAEIRAAQERVIHMDARVQISSFETQEVRVFGDVAEEDGVSNLDVVKPGGEHVAVKGRYLTLWHRGADGVWRVQADASMSEPKPAPTKSP
jgi:uncharacterized protein (TIGR02246 family)